MAETIKRGQIKRKINSTDVEILRPETEAEIVIYDNTTSELAATNVQAAIDEVAAAVAVAGKVDDVKINGTSIVDSEKIAKIAVDGTYNASSNKIATESTVSGAIAALDGNITGTPGAGKTLTAFSETDGIVSATFGDISITSSQISDKTDSYSSTGTVAVTGKAIAAALETLDTSANVAPAVVSGSGNAQKITFKDIKETDGIIAAGSNITNAVTYTDGAIDTLLATKLDKLTTNGNKVYAHQGATQTEYGVDSGASPNYIVQRDSNGQIIVPQTPTEDYHAASKKYVDDKITQGVEYLGIVDDTAELYALDSSAGEGDWVRVGTQFTYSSETCHVGDILICSAAKGSSTHATWDVIHTEVDTDTNTTYQTTVGAGSGTSYAGTILLQKKELGQSSYTTQDTIKFINGASGKISISPNTTNKTLTIEHAAGSGASQSSGFYKFSTDATSHISGVTAVAKADLTGLGVADDLLVVHKGSSSTASNEDIYGTKTFKSGGIAFAGGGYGDNPLLRSSTIGAGGPAVELTGTGLVVNNIKMSGGFYTPDNGNAKVLLPDTTDWGTDNKTLATLDDIPAVDDFVTGPASSTNNYIAVFDGTTGKTIKQGDLAVEKVNNSVYLTGNGSSGHLYVRASNYGGIDLINDASSISLAPYLGQGSTKNIGTSSNKWTNLYLSGNLSDGTNSTTIANIVAGLTTNVKSGKNSGGDSGSDISGTKSGTIITLGDSGIAVNEDSTKGPVGVATYSAIMVNRKGIAVAGGQILDVIAHGGTPNVINGGWYFEELATA